jgi:uncharacterized repeat protein (TIGR01451 family)
VFNTTYVLNSAQNLQGTPISAVSTSTVGLFKPSVTLQVFVDKSSAQVGDLLTYTVVITNSSTSNSPNLINFSLSETVPDPTPPTIPPLAPGASFQFSYVHVVSATDPNPLTNTVVAHFHPAPTGMHTGDFAFTNDVFNSGAVSTGIITVVTKSFFFARSGGMPSTPSTALLTYVANQFSHSDEYYTDVVKSAYQQLLDRTPGDGEVSGSGWVSLLRGGWHDEQLDTAIVFSQEFISKSASAGGWVQSLYLHLLGRPGSPSEWNTWVGKSPADIAHGIIYSPEHEDQVIAAAYQSILGRAAGSTELSSWYGNLMSGMRIEDVIAIIAGSGECFSIHNHDDEVAWIMNAGYEGILHRAADAGYLGYLNELQHGVPGIPF